MPISEEQLVAVLLREQPRLLAFLNALVRHETLADDLFQDLSLKAVHARPTIETEKHFVYWLYRTARHRAIDELRKAKIPCLDDRVLDLMESDWSEPSSAGTSERAEALGRCLELLQPAARRLVEMRYDDGLSGADIAERINRKPATVYMQLSRVRQRLLDCVKSRMAGRSIKGGSE